MCALYELDRWAGTEAPPLHFVVFTKYTPTYIGVYYLVIALNVLPERGNPPDFDEFISAKSHKTSVTAQSC